MKTRKIKGVVYRTLEKGEKFDAGCMNLTWRQIVNFKRRGDGLCLECWAINQGGVAPDEEAGMCGWCGEEKVVGADVALDMRLLNPVETNLDTLQWLPQDVVTWRPLVAYPGYGPDDIGLVPPTGG